MEVAWWIAGIVFGCVVAFSASWIVAKMANDNSFNHILDRIEALDAKSTDHTKRIRSLEAINEPNSFSNHHRSVPAGAFDEDHV